MSKKPLVISYFTKNTVYEKEAEGLIQTCLELGVETDIEGVDDLGSWEKNCCFKPTFVLEKLKQHKRPLLWIDCDGVVLKKPYFFDKLNCDIACRIKKKEKVSDDSKLLTSTVFFNDTKQVSDLLKIWKDECDLRLKAKREYEVWDQVCLKDLIFSQKIKGLKVKNLSRNYCYFFDERPSLNKEKVCILHFQASRLRSFFSKDLCKLPFFYQNASEIRLKILRQHVDIPFQEENFSAPSSVQTYLDLFKFLKK
jgi:hypothetical protein